MNLKEAKEVMRGERSYSPADSQVELVAQVAMSEANANLAMEAYWVLRAHREGLAYEVEFTGAEVTD